MGDLNQLLFVKKYADKVKGPILEVGSKDYGNTQNLRPLFENYDYVGVDMEDGPGVDIVIDLTEDISIIKEKLDGNLFKTIFCFCVLEHCTQPFKLCNNLESLLDENGVIFVSAPFSWRIHGYPSDYWRFTSEGIKLLFPNIEFDMACSNLTSTSTGYFKPIDDYMLRIELDATKAKERKIYNNFTLFAMRVIRKTKIIPWIANHSYLFPPVNINMVGIKK